MAQKLLKKYPQLGNFTRSSYDNLLDRLQALDESIKNGYRERTAFVVAKREVPMGTGSGYVGDYTGYSLIRHELSKKKRHIPIRQLVHRAGNALQALKPCFMMSP